MKSSSIRINLYHQMLRIRMVEEEIARRYHEQEMRCPVHLYIGQEAIATGVCAHLEKKDIVLSNHRSHGHYLAKGGSLPALIAELYGKETGCSKGRGGSQHLIDLSANFWGSTPIVGGVIPVATGIAWAVKMNRHKKVVVVFIGDAAIEEGVFYESLNFASLKKLPILYVCENNFYSILTPLHDRQPDRPIYTMAKAHKMLSFAEDGNDIGRVYKTAQKALLAIRAGHGPAFIEFHTYRLKEHCGPNEELIGDRPLHEYKTWQKRSPIKAVEKELKKHEVTADTLAKMRQAITKEISDAFTFALKSPYLTERPSQNLVFTNATL